MESLKTKSRSETLFSTVVQIGIVVSDVSKAMVAYRDLLGINDWNINLVDTAIGKGRNFYKNGISIEAKAKIAWVLFGNVELELIEPQDQHSLYAEFLRKHGPGIHHIMFGTADFVGCLEHMTGQNVATIGSGELQSSRFHLFDTQKLLGFICEIAEGDPLVPDQELKS